MSRADWYHTDIQRILLLLSANRLKLQTYVQNEPGVSPIGKSIRDTHTSKLNKLMQLKQSDNKHWPMVVYYRR